MHYSHRNNGRVCMVEASHCAVVDHTSVKPFTVQQTFIEPRWLCRWRKGSRRQSLWLGPWTQTDVGSSPGSTLNRRVVQICTVALREYPHRVVRIKGNHAD